VIGERISPKWFLKFNFTLAENPKLAGYTPRTLDILNLYPAILYPDKYSTRISSCPKWSKYGYFIFVSESARFSGDYLSSVSRQTSGCLSGLECRRLSRTTRNIVLRVNSCQADGHPFGNAETLEKLENVDTIHLFALGRSGTAIACGCEGG